MKKWSVTILVSLALSVTLLPAAAVGGAWFASHRGSSTHAGSFPHQRPHGGHGFGATSSHHNRFVHVFPGHGKFHHHGKFHGRFGHHHRHAFVSLVPSVTYCCASPVAYSPPVVPAVIYTAPAMYPFPPASYAQAGPVAPTPPAVAPMPTVIEHGTGRYELRGDGVTTPYVWVWIPNPPPAPPLAPAPEPPPSGPAPPASPGKLYRWTDEEGTTFWTNRPDRVPDPYRPGAPRPRPPDADPS